MLSAQISITPANVWSATFPLPRLLRNSRIADGFSGSTAAAPCPTKFVSCRCAMLFGVLVASSVVMQYDFPSILRMAHAPIIPAGLSPL